MIQDLIIKVNASEPLSEIGSGYVLLYDANQGCYFATTREALFAVQDNKIKLLEKQMNDFMTKQEQKTDEFIKSIDKRFDDFLETYKNTNSKLIDMVEAVIKEE